MKTIDKLNGSEVFFESSTHDELVGKASFLLAVVEDPQARQLATEIHQTLLCDYLQVDDDSSWE